MITVVDKKKLDSNTVFITIEGDKPSELNGPEAKVLVFDAGMEFGLKNPGISSEGGFYPAESAETDPKKKIQKFRKEFKLWAGL